MIKLQLHLTSSDLDNPREEILPLLRILAEILGLALLVSDWVMSWCLNPCYNPSSWKPLSCLLITGVGVGKVESTPLEQVERRGKSGSLKEQ